MRDRKYIKVKLNEVIFYYILENIYFNLSKHFNTIYLIKF